jgi:hypothetical protein
MNKMDKIFGAFILFIAVAGLSIIIDKAKREESYDAKCKDLGGIPAHSEFAGPFCFAPNMLIKVPK